MKIDDDGVKEAEFTLCGSKLRFKDRSGSEEGGEGGSTVGVNACVKSLANGFVNGVSQMGEFFPAKAVAELAPV